MSDALSSHASVVCRDKDGMVCGVGVLAKMVYLALVLARLRVVGLRGIGRQVWLDLNIWVHEASTLRLVRPVGQGLAEHLVAVEAQVVLL